ncbi:hypothetical protein [Spiroplasma endosymbiont of Phyllotreta cruciferae]|uniref:hypothetical protein n=1 Tax=Spiroplasma endosymbiont of Phyllotreta cruciferae TaxID=2886375 RepID=UPI0020A0AD89|nr:hypothetical protein [Spiroplasma endosymbiont of Phyllotreta cruciferae]
MMGALVKYIINASPTNFQPMKANFGIVPSLEQHFKEKADKYLAYSDRALTELANFIKNNRLNDEINF